MSDAAEPSSEPAGPSFVVVLSAHQTLDRLFQMHQELLLARQPQLSLKLLQTYRELLQVHMTHEERWLFPIFRRPPQHPRWPLVLYEGQHRKLLKLLDGCQLELEAASARGSLARSFVLALLERETTFKHLSEHHDGAERQGFFPALDTKATSDELAHLPSQCQSDFARELRRFEPLIVEARSRLDNTP